MNTLSDIQKLRIEAISENMALFMTRHDGLEGDEPLMRENILALEDLKSGRIAPRALCAELRAIALKTAHRSPFVAASLEALANEFQVLSTN